MGIRKQMELQKIRSKNKACIYQNNPDKNELLGYI
jgi:hypothetical protein